MRNKVENFARLYTLRGHMIRELDARRQVLKVVRKQQAEYNRFTVQLWKDESARKVAENKRMYRDLIERLRGTEPLPLP